MRRAGSLPDRIWRALRDRGPNYAAALAGELGARDAAVTQALASLQRRGLVEIDRRDGRRVLFRALDDEHDDGAIGRAAWPGYRLADDLALLRAAYGTSEIEALMLDNRPTGL